MMAIDLLQYEKGVPLEGDYGDRLAELQDRLGRLQAAHIAHRHRTIIVFEGWDAAGKGGAIRRMAARWDPRHFEVWPISAPTTEEKERHFLYRFWHRLPGLGDIAIFDRSWYGRVLVERVEGFASEAEWRRGYDEINEFEAQQGDIGTHIIKFFLHVSQEEQDERLRSRLENPYKQWKLNADDFRNRARRDDYMTAAADMFAQTDTRWAPWTVIDANDKKAARISVLSHVAEQLDQWLPDEFPKLDPELRELAERSLLPSSA